MLLKTFIEHLIEKPESVRHDAYEDKDILMFKKIDGFFPYIEFQSKPIDKTQKIYFDVLNWEFEPKTRYVDKNIVNTLSFMKIFNLKKDNALSVFDCINERL